MQARWNVPNCRLILLRIIETNQKRSRVRQRVRGKFLCDNNKTTSRAWTDLFTWCKCTFFDQISDLTPNQRKKKENWRRKKRNRHRPNSNFDEMNSWRRKKQHRWKKLFFFFQHSFLRSFIYTCTHVHIITFTFTFRANDGFFVQVYIVHSKRFELCSILFLGSFFLFSSYENQSRAFEIFLYSPLVFSLTFFQPLSLLPWCSACVYSSLSLLVILPFPLFTSAYIWICMCLLLYWVLHVFVT